MGHTRVATAIAADLVAPFGDRGNEGRVVYSVHLSPLAFPEGGSSGETSELCCIEFGLIGCMLSLQICFFLTPSIDGHLLQLFASIAPNLVAGLIHVQEI